MIMKTTYSKDIFPYSESILQNKKKEEFEFENKLSIQFEELNLEKELPKSKFRVLTAKYTDDTSLKEWNTTIKTLTEKMANISYYLREVKEISRQDDDGYCFLMIFEKSLEE